MIIIYHHKGKVILVERFSFVSVRLVPLREDEFHVFYLPDEARDWLTPKMYRGSTGERVDDGLDD
jgi:hypothetical protein